jgi:hypothetical protein
MNAVPNSKLMCEIFQVLEEKKKTNESDWHKRPLKVFTFFCICSSSTWSVLQGGFRVVSVVHLWQAVFRNFAVSLSQAPYVCNQDFHLFHQMRHLRSYWSHALRNEMQWKVGTCHNSCPVALNNDTQVRAQLFCQYPSILSAHTEFKC